MRTRVFLVLLLIVVLPLLLLGGLGLRLISSEQQAVGHRLQTLIGAQLQTVDDLIQSYFTELAQRLTADAQQLAQDSDILRAYIRRTPPLRQVFVVSAGGDRLHPPADALLSAEDSAVEVRIVPTDEESVISRHTLDALP